MRAAFARAGGQAALGCPPGLAHTWGRVVIQELVQPGPQPAGVLLSGRPDLAIPLSSAEWGSYSQIGNKTGNNASVVAGYPTAIRIEPNAIVLPLSMGGVLTGERTDSAFFYVPQQWLEVWNADGGASGGLGMVTSNLYSAGDATRQDFTHGYLLMGATDSIRVISTRLTTAGLPQPLPHDAILREPDGTAWWIDGRRFRWWIPDGGTWECLGGWNRLAQNNVPGYAIEAFAVGGQATCSQNP